MPYSLSLIWNSYSFLLIQWFYQYSVHPIVVCLFTHLASQLKIFSFVAHSAATLTFAHQKPLLIFAHPMVLSIFCSSNCCMFIHTSCKWTKILLICCSFSSNTHICSSETLAHFCSSNGFINILFILLLTDFSLNGFIHCLSMSKANAYMNKIFLAHSLKRFTSVISSVLW